MTNEVQIKSLISEFANEASDSELSVLLEIAALANTAYNQRLSHVSDQLGKQMLRVKSADQVRNAMKKAASVNNGTRKRFPEGYPQSSEDNSIDRLIQGVEKIANDQHNGKGDKPGSSEIKLAGDVKKFVHDVLTDKRTKSNPELITAVTGLLAEYNHIISLIS